LLIDDKPLTRFLEAEGEIPTGRTAARCEPPRSDGRLACRRGLQWALRRGSSVTADENFDPPDDARRWLSSADRLLGLVDQPEDAGTFDLAWWEWNRRHMYQRCSAARSGCKSRYFQDRPDWGGNNSSEECGSPPGRCAFTCRRIEGVGWPRGGRVVIPAPEDNGRVPRREFGDDKKLRSCRKRKTCICFAHARVPCGDGRNTESAQ